MKKGFKLEDVPSEVMHVWSIQLAKQPVGMTAYEAIQKIIDKYPQWFEWEHTYKSIPQEVHDAFSKECYPERYELLNCIDKDINLGEGFMSQVTRGAESFKIPSTSKEWKQMFVDWEESMNKQEQERIAYEKGVRKIWNKHYSKYKLECRENF